VLRTCLEAPWPRCGGSFFAMRRAPSCWKFSNAGGRPGAAKREIHYRQQDEQRVQPKGPGLPLTECPKSQFGRDTIAFPRREEHCGRLRILDLDPERAQHRPETVGFSAMLRKRCPPANLQACSNNRRADFQLDGRRFGFPRPVWARHCRAQCEARAPLLCQEGQTVV
jgi:hypothetical protein